MGAATNVVRLPTAARRKVQQRYNKHFRAIVPEMRAQWPGEYIDPGVRAKMPDAAALLLVERSPELLLAIAMFETLTEEQRTSVRNRCEMLKYTGASARGAAALIQIRTIGDSVNLDAAMKLLKENVVAPYDFD
ncbi:hypothetical protein [Altererythrobacter sp. Root672]|uniref:hypothetical protein n=1 Tax=Altererythrobacter sp. Root672 TaxID=1736584 RepID=UPI0006FF8AC9|nr:hypothetical protein [Altererythrobacter sp. Root672]KRA80307.1 hypothetical protein ASD76_14080 [Altererythrobacter sp. Root672]